MVSVIVIGRNECARLEACFKSIEKAWDEFIPSFLESNGIETELL